jgi:tetratricopeptide (TPR) repeat protein
MPQHFEVDFRVRRQIFRCLKTLAEESLENDIWSVYQEACLQLAFCYRIGFGVERADATAEMFLVQSQMRQVLEDQLVALKSSVNQCYNPFAIFGLWHARGHVPTSTDAQYYREQKQLTSIQVVHEREILGWRTVLGTAHWIVIVKTGHYCSILENLGYLDKAEELARDIFTEVSRTLPDNHLAVKEIKYTLARALYMQGKLAMAEKLVKEVVEMQKTFSDEIDHTILSQMNFMACIYATQGKRRKAAALMETILRNFSEALGKYHIHTIIIMWNLCEIFRQQRRIKQAIRLNENIIQTATEALGEDHEISVLARMSLTRLRWERRTWIGGYIGSREDDALRLDYIENSQALLGNNHSWTLEIIVSTVRNLFSKARFDEAIALQGQIVALSEKRPGPNHPHTIAHRNHLTYIKKVYRSYRFFERIGSLNMGGYVLTPGFRVGEGLERICWPLYRKKDMSKFVKKPFSVDLSVGSDQS